MAPRYRRRFEKKGMEASQRQLLEGLERAGFKNAAVLEIGSGVGYLHQYLLRHGAATAVGIDLAPNMIEQAQALARAQALAERTHYLAGDFVDLADSVEPADIAILDKVICCYPDAERIVRGSVAKAKRVYAYTIPRDRWYTRLGTALIALAFRLARSDFRPYVHDPERIEAWVTAAGFAKRYENRTRLWLTEVYVRG